MVRAQIEHHKTISIAIFFFQAEDVIRDGHVTGVQTCALPISQSFNLFNTGSQALTYYVTNSPITFPFLIESPDQGSLSSGQSVMVRVSVEHVTDPGTFRSEERRVGDGW